MTEEPSMKRRIFWVRLTVFLRLRVYEAIAVIFWQSRSYYYSIVKLFNNCYAFNISEHINIVQRRSSYRFVLPEIKKEF